jgi:hypothetical protein
MAARTPSDGDPGGTDDFSTLESGLEVVHFEGDMRHSLDELV